MCKLNTFVTVINAFLVYSTIRAYHHLSQWLNLESRRLCVLRHDRLGRISLCRLGVTPVYVKNDGALDCLGTYCIHCVRHFHFRYISISYGNDLLFLLLVSRGRHHSITRKHNRCHRYDFLYNKQATIHNQCKSSNTVRRLLTNPNVSTDK